MNVSSIAVVSAVLVTAVALAWALTRRDTTARYANTKLGTLFVGLYLGLFAIALLIWQGQEGLGLASILFGMPWSTLCALVLNELLNMDSILGAPWETVITTLSMFGVGLNCVIVYNIGQRIGASLAAAQRR